jgi:alpha-L-fucosidase
MQAIGAWMKTNGEAIYSTQASPFPKLAWGRCTQKSLPGGRTRLYLHVFDWPGDGRLVVPLVVRGAAQARLGVNGKALTVTAGEKQTTIAVGDRAPDAVASVIELDIQGAPAAASPV